MKYDKKLFFILGYLTIVVLLVLCIIQVNANVHQRKLIESRQFELTPEQKLARVQLIFQTLTQEQVAEIIYKECNFVEEKYRIFNYCGWNK